MTTTPTIWLGDSGVNTSDGGTGGDDQYASRFVQLTDGTYILAWSDNSDEEGSNGLDIIGQRFDAMGIPMGGEFRVNNGFFVDDESDFEIAALPNGSFVVVYNDVDVNGGAIRYNTLAADGSVMTTGTIAVDPGADFVSAPSVAVNPDGSFLVFYQQDTGSAISGYRVLVDTAGTVGAPALTGTGSDSAAYTDTASATLSNGNAVFVATYHTGSEHSLIYSIRTFDGTTISPITFVATTGSNTEYDASPVVAALTGGGFVIAWVNQDTDVDITFQRYDNAGVAQGSPTVTHFGFGDDYGVEPTITGLNDGGFFIAWHDAVDNQIQGQRFDATGTPVGDLVIIDDNLDGGDYADGPSVGLLQDGRISVTWTEYSSGATDQDVRQVILDPRETTTDYSSSTTGLTITTRIEGSTVIGTNSEDIIYGQDGDDVISGGSLHDVIYGGGGGDLLQGGFDDDEVHGGTGNDSLYAMTEAAPDNSTYSDFLYGDGGSDYLRGSLGSDTLDGGTDADQMVGGDGSDVYFVDNAGDTVTELQDQGDDTVNSSVTFSIYGGYVERLTLTGAGNINATGNGSNNTITGNVGNNVINGGKGADAMLGGAGNDTYYVDNAGDTVTELNGAGTDTVNSSVTFSLYGQYIENLTLTGSDNIDGTGTGSNNVINGNAGNNVINGRAGADAMSGGAGNDTYIVDNAGDTVIEAYAAGTDTVNSSVTFSLYGQYIENLTLTGSAHIDGTGTSADNTITGNAGNNVINGRAGADAMIGGAGNDTYYVDNAGDTVVEANGQGTDTVNSSVTFSLYGQYIENLTLTGSANIDGTGTNSDNTITGNAGNNVINGRNGADAMIGGAGDDTYYVDNAGDTIVEAYASGTDQVFSSVSFSLSGQYIENLTLTGSANIDGTGTSSANVITGNGAINALNGGKGDDRIIGGLGADVLTGGQDTDTFVYASTSESSLGASDRITDLTNTDVINLQAIDARTNVGGNNGFTIVSAFTGVSGQMTLSYNAGTNLTSILMDTDGNGVADMRIEINGDHDDFTNFVF